MAGSVLFISLIASGNLVFDTDLARFALDVVKLSVNEIGNLRNAIPSYQLMLPAQAVDATLAWSLLGGVWNPRVFLGR